MAKKINVVETMKARALESFQIHLEGAIAQEVVRPFTFAFRLMCRSLLQEFGSTFYSAITNDEWARILGEAAGKAEKHETIPLQEIYKAFNVEARFLDVGILCADAKIARLLNAWEKKLPHTKGKNKSNAKAA